MPLDPLLIENVARMCAAEPSSIVTADVQRLLYHVYEAYRSARDTVAALEHRVESQIEARVAIIRDRLTPESKPAGPIPILLWCPQCRARHIDEGEFATKIHHTHACQGCGLVWRPALVPTVGVQYLPGFKNDVAAT